MGELGVFGRTAWHASRAPFYVFFGLRRGYSYTADPVPGGYSSFLEPQWELAMLQCLDRAGCDQPASPWTILSLIIICVFCHRRRHDGPSSGRYRWRVVARGVSRKMKSPAPDLLMDTGEVAEHARRSWRDRDHHGRPHKTSGI